MQRKMFSILAGPFLTFAISGIFAAFTSIGSSALAYSANVNLIKGSYYGIKWFFLSNIFAAFIFTVALVCFILGIVMLSSSVSSPPNDPSGYSFLGARNMDETVGLGLVLLIISGFVIIATCFSAIAIYRNSRNVQGFKDFNNACKGEDVNSLFKTRAAEYGITPESLKLVFAKHLAQEGITSEMLKDALAEPHLTQAYLTDLVHKHGKRSKTDYTSHLSRAEIIELGKRIATKESRANYPEIVQRAAGVKDRIVNVFGTAIGPIKSAVSVMSNVAVTSGGILQKALARGS